MTLPLTHADIYGKAPVTSAEAIDKNKYKDITYEISRKCQLHGID